MTAETEKQPVLEPVNDQVAMVDPPAAEEKKLILPPSAQDPVKRGVVIAVSEDVDFGGRMQVGDVVLYLPAHVIEIYGQRLVPARNIVAIEREERSPT